MKKLAVTSPIRFDRFELSNGTFSDVIRSDPPRRRFFGVLVTAIALGTLASTIAAAVAQRDTASQKDASENELRFVNTHLPSSR